MLMNLDSSIDNALRPIADTLIQMIFYSVEFSGAQVPLIVIWLITAGIIFTSYFGFLNLTGIKHSLKVIRGDYADPNDPGEVTHFQALSTALSGTVGLGNIAGVAIAVSIGGPGATFWMILAGLLGMSTKFLECSLGLKYRHINPDGTVHGGPMFYLQQGLAKQNKPKLGKALAVFFAICCVVASLCGSNMLQANQAYQQFIVVINNDSGFWAQHGWLFGLILAIVIAAVILGGMKSIAKVTSKVVPLMAAVYLFSALFIILSQASKIPDVIVLIVTSAFSTTSVAGGMLGVMIQGFKRATFSSESGVGAASIAHATASTKEPIREGYVALLEPFIDTVVICTITALVIVISGEYQNSTGVDGVALTSRAFASVINWFPYLLSVAVLLFALSTMISWAYYGSIAWGYLFGENKWLDRLYKLIFCGFTIIGASASLHAVIDISDAMFFSMAIANIIGLYLLAPEIKQDLKHYQSRYIKN